MTANGLPRIDMDGVCRTCRFTTTKPGHTAIYKLGYRNCEHKPVYMYVPGHATCEKWEKK